MGPGNTDGPGGRGGAAAMSVKGGAGVTEDQGGAGGNVELKVESSGRLVNPCRRQGDV